jgi:hypothetical protein
MARRANARAIFLEPSPMQKPLPTLSPFTLTDEMQKELVDEISSLAPKGDDATHDPAGARTFAPRLRRGNANLPNSGGDAPGYQDNPEVAERHPAALEEDPINPSHYRRHPSGIECIDITEHMLFNPGNAVKYIWRYMDKGDPVENLRKAQWYLEREILRLTRVPR